MFGMGWCVHLQEDSHTTLPHRPRPWGSSWHSSWPPQRESPERTSHTLPLFLHLVCEKQVTETTSPSKVWKVNSNLESEGYQKNFWIWLKKKTQHDFFHFWRLCFLKSTALQMNAKYEGSHFLQSLIENGHFSCLCPCPSGHESHVVYLWTRVKAGRREIQAVVTSSTTAILPDVVFCRTGSVLPVLAHPILQIAQALSTMIDVL